jgi:hypothetical protein
MLAVLPILFTVQPFLLDVLPYLLAAQLLASF